MLAFLDRSNIGNAALAGMEEDLHLSSDQYDWLLTIFYITYVIFEVIKHVQLLIALNNGIDGFKVRTAILENLSSPCRRRNSGVLVVSIYFKRTINHIDLC